MQPVEERLELVRFKVDKTPHIRVNSEAYKHIQLRPRRLRDASNIDTRISLFGADQKSSPLSAIRSCAVEQIAEGIALVERALQTQTASAPICCRLRSRRFTPRRTRPLPRTGVRSRASTAGSQAVSLPLLWN